MRVASADFVALPDEGMRSGTAYAAGIGYPSSPDRPPPGVGRQRPEPDVDAERSPHPRPEADSRETAEQLTGEAGRS